MLRTRGFAGEVTPSERKLPTPSGDPVRASLAGGTVPLEGEAALLATEVAQPHGPGRASHGDGSWCDGVGAGTMRPPQGASAPPEASQLGPPAGMATPAPAGRQQRNASGGGGATGAAPQWQRSPSGAWVKSKSGWAAGESGREEGSGRALAKSRSSPGSWDNRWEEGGWDNHREEGGSDVLQADAGVLPGVARGIQPGVAGDEGMAGLAHGNLSPGSSDDDELGAWDGGVRGGPAHGRQGSSLSDDDELDGGLGGASDHGRPTLRALGGGGFVRAVVGAGSWMRPMPGALDSAGLDMRGGGDIGGVDMAGVGYSLDGVPDDIGGVDVSGVGYALDGVPDDIGDVDMSGVGYALDGIMNDIGGVDVSDDAASDISDPSGYRSYVVMPRSITKVCAHVVWSSSAHRACGLRVRFPSHTLSVHNPVLYTNIITGNLSLIYKGGCGLAWT